MEQLNRVDRGAETRRGETPGPLRGGEGALGTLRAEHERHVERAREPRDLPVEYTAARRRLESRQDEDRTHVERGAASGRQVDAQVYFYAEAKAWLRARNSGAARGCEAFTTTLPAREALGAQFQDPDGLHLAEGATVDVTWGARRPGEDWRAESITINTRGDQERLRPPTEVDSLDEPRSEGRTPPPDLTVAPPLRETVWADHPADYDQPGEVQERAAGRRTAAFEHPERWIEWVNPGGPRGPFDTGADPRRTVNCADCSRAVERNWRGEAQVAAGLRLNGEGTDRTESWARTTFRTAGLARVRDLLRREGHGASAIIGVDWKLGGGHYFNAVNHEGTILAVDGQTGVVAEWPPEESVFGYGEDDMAFTEVILRNGRGEEVSR